MSLESTTYPGTTEEELRPRIESRGFTVGDDYYLVYSPEREDPGNKDFGTTTIPKVVGGTTPACARGRRGALRAPSSTQVVPVRSTQVAEFTKLLENIYRAVNIGLVNELKVAADKMGIDIWEVIDAAATKPFGFKPFYPGPGLGGHCIPIDPFYLTWKAREYGVHTRFIELAGQINTSMPALRRRAHHGGAQHALQGGAGQPHPPHGPRLQGERRRHARVARPSSCSTNSPTSAQRSNTMTRISRWSARPASTPALDWEEIDRMERGSRCATSTAW